MKNKYHIPYTPPINIKYNNLFTKIKQLPPEVEREQTWDPGEQGPSEHRHRWQSGLLPQGTPGQDAGLLLEWAIE